MGISRRSTLTAAGVCLVPLAGCGSFAREGIRLGYLAVENEHTATHDVQVLLLDNGEPVFWRTVRAGGYDEEGNAVGGEILSSYPDDPGSYVLYAKLTGESGWKSSDFDELDATCCQAIVKIRGDESVEILRSAGCE